MCYLKDKRTEKTNEDKVLSLSINVNIPKMMSKQLIRSIPIPLNLLTAYLWLDYARFYGILFPVMRTFF